MHHLPASMGQTTACYGTVNGTYTKSKTQDFWIIFLSILFTVIWRQTYNKGPLSERGNPLPSHRLLFLISSKGYFICTERIAHQSLYYTSRGALAGTRNSSMGPP